MLVIVVLLHEWKFAREIVGYNKVVEDGDFALKKDIKTFSDTKVTSIFQFNSLS